jgi:2-alkyl-3-oxoalkanoate reductase
MKALVTGGGGFLGKAIIKSLLAKQVEVHSIARQDYPELRKLGVTTFRGDIANQEQLDQAAQGCDVVFHVAAKAGVWGSYASYFESNVLGTYQVIQTCLRLRIPKLVYTSTPSVIHAGSDVCGADESLPYPDHFEAFYPQTKAIAERAVLEVNQPALATVALRPHLIWGPGDQHLIPRLVARAKQGRLRLVGNGENKIDSVYIDNAVAAHILAWEQLKFGSPCAGKAYFISQGDPWPSGQLINRILASAGIPPVTKSISPRAAYVVGALLEAGYTLLGKQDEPPMTRFVAKQLATDHWYNLQAAARDLGYQPQVTIEEGLEKLRTWFQAGQPAP